jgi:hypothetical protein
MVQYATQSVDANAQAIASRPERGPSELFDGATFMPIDYPLRTEILAEEVWKQMQAMLVALGMKAARQAPDAQAPDAYEHDFRDALRRFLDQPDSERRRFTEFPALRIWLRETTKILAQPSPPAESGPEAVRVQLGEFGNVVQRFEDRYNNPAVLTVPGTSLQVTRLSVDPLIAKVAPPTYVFPDQSGNPVPEGPTAYSLPFFVEVAATALEQIRRTWPAAYDDFNRFVRLLVHLPDAEFRSCSADRYAGVIFMSADDATVLDVEESLIHEYGHQILYNVMELDPLIADGAVDQFTLPWSGAQRDFYGYFHAFYIYVLLLCYFERVRGRPDEEQRRAEGRIADILRGALQAATDFESAVAFTPQGRALFVAVRGVLEQLKQRHAHLL